MAPRALCFINIVEAPWLFLALLPVTVLMTVAYRSRRAASVTSVHSQSRWGGLHRPLEDGNPSGNPVKAKAHPFREK